MEAIFCLPYPEYNIATLLQKYFKKNDGYSVAIPLSRQQKGFDLLVYSLKTKKALSFQVKSSRAWSGEKPTRGFQYSSWFWKFEPNEDIDFYVFSILYAKSASDKKRLGKENPKKWWASRIILFGKSEITALFKELKTKTGNPEKFFYFGFDEKPQDIFITRGLPLKSFKENLLVSQIKNVRDKLQ